MWLRSLELQNFRNYERRKFEFKSHINLVVGLNGKGKSNLIEAIQLLSVTRSPKTNHLEEAIQFEKSLASIHGKIKENNQEQDIRILLNRHGKKIELNGKVLERSSDLFSIFHTVHITGEDFRIITMTPANRRQYLDTFLSKFDSQYFYELTKFKKINKQKNSLLKLPWNQPKELLKTYQEELFMCHRIIAGKRKHFLNELGVKMNNYLSHFFKGEQKLNVDLHYIDTLPEEKNMHEVLVKEQQYKESLFGAHRDDFGVFMGGYDLKKYMSQGEKQLTALVMKLSEKDMVLEKKFVNPVILIDDAWHGLDETRKELFRKLLLDPCQKIITSPHQTNELWESEKIEMIEL